jgi:hypothetical protein
MQILLHPHPKLRHMHTCKIYMFKTQTEEGVSSNAETPCVFSQYAMHKTANREKKKRGIDRSNSNKQQSSKIVCTKKTRAKKNDFLSTTPAAHVAAALLARLAHSLSLLLGLAHHHHLLNLLLVHLAHVHALHGLHVLHILHIHALHVLHVHTLHALHVDVVHHALGELAALLQLLLAHGEQLLLAGLVGALLLEHLLVLLHLNGVCGNVVGYAAVRHAVHLTRHLTWHLPLHTAVHELHLGLLLGLLAREDSLLELA